jgi:(2Fe-2S) ferredoxin
MLYAGVSTPTGGWLERIELDDVHDTLDLDLSGVADATTVGGDRIDTPLYLVCTNGKHDPCCATFGLPVARALDELAPGRVWECSHVGGDRFAGNLVCLPDGLLYGQLDPDSARAVVATHEGGRIALDRWRGRSALPFPAQAAEALARRELGISRIDGLAVAAVERAGATHEVRLRRRDGREVVAVVSVDRGGAPRQLTCAGAPAVAPTYRLDELRTGDGPSS